MAYDFHSRLNHTGNRFQEMGVEVIYKRAGVAVNTFTAFPVLQQAEELIPGISVTRIEYQNWGFPASELSSASPDTPQPGDTITNNSTGEIFRVIDMNGAVYRHTTASRNRFLVHTERLSK